MKKHFSLLFLLVTISFSAQENTKDYSKQVATLDSTIETLYSVISGDAGVERDWDLFKYLFHKDAKLIPTGKTKDGKHAARYMTPEDYIQSSGKWLYEMSGKISQDI